MGLYDYAWPSTYEEIKRFYPVWYWDVLEMDAIWKAQGKELDGIRSAVESLISNNYIATADEPAIADLEMFLGITPDTAQSIEERRQVIASSFKGNSHIGAPEIKEITRSFISDCSISVTFENGIIHLWVEKPYKSTCNYLSCYMVLSNSIPAHLHLDMKVVSTLKRELTMYTGLALRTSKVVTLTMETVEVSSYAMLADENGIALLDGDGSIILDG